MVLLIDTNIVLDVLLNHEKIIFSKGGFTDGLLQKQEHGEVCLITLEDLYK